MAAPEDFGERLCHGCRGFHGSAGAELNCTRARLAEARERLKKLDLIERCAREYYALPMTKDGSQADRVHKRGL
jgi:hypothetical protein